MHPSNEPYRFLAAALIFVLLAAAVLAGRAALADEGLYGPAAPPGSAFVRIFNGSSQSILDAKVGPEDFNEIPPYDASECAFLPPGSYALSAGGATAQVQLQPDRYYTAALLDGKVTVLDNPRYGNRMKALVMVYNLSGDASLSLRTADGKTKVVDEVAPKTFGSREVNPVKANFALYKGEAKVADVRPISLERGRAFGLFVAGTASQPMPVWVVN